jgi:hypothetical protein
MSRRVVWTLAVVVSVGMATPAAANDGRDRYRGHGPNLLYLFPDPVGAAAGYRVLPKDLPGGADGDRAFRWAQAPGIALVRLAAYETHSRFGAAQAPLAIFDLSAENGDTPIQFEPGKPPRGRHPGGSHDGGINLDLGYYLNSLKGKKFTPDHAACTEHFYRDGKDAWHCRGPADRLDVLRQAFFMLQLLRLDQRMFSGHLVREIGIDRQIRRRVLAQVRSWVAQRKYSATRVVFEQLRRLCTADRWEGWARSHHHHIHLRLRQLTPTGAWREGRERLLEQERWMDRQLLQQQSKDSGPVLRARLLSYGLRRAVELEVLGQVKAKQVRFRLDGGAWIDRDPADYRGHRAVIDLPPAFHRAGRRARAEAEIVDHAGKRRSLQRALLLPRLEPQLAVGIDPAPLRPYRRRQGARWLVGVEMPEAYRVLVTGIKYRVYRAGAAEPEELVGSGAAMTGRVDTGRRRPTVELIEAEVLASGRQTLRLTVYCATP